jgi:hypothetical protein
LRRGRNAEIGRRNFFEIQLLVKSNALSTVRGVERALILVRLGLFLTTAAEMDPKPSSIPSAPGARTARPYKNLVRERYAAN